MQSRVLCYYWMNHRHFYSSDDSGQVMQRRPELTLPSMTHRGDDSSTTNWRQSRMVLIPTFPPPLQPALFCLGCSSGYIREVPPSSSVQLVLRKQTDNSSADAVLSSSIKEFRQQRECYFTRKENPLLQRELSRSCLRHSGTKDHVQL